MIFPVWGELCALICSRRQHPRDGRAAVPFALRQRLLFSSLRRRPVPGRGMRRPRSGAAESPTRRPLPVPCGSRATSRLHGGQQDFLRCAPQRGSSGSAQSTLLLDSSFAIIAHYSYSKKDLYHHIVVIYNTHFRGSDSDGVHVVQKKKIKDKRPMCPSRRKGEKNSYVLQGRDGLQRTCITSGYVEYFRIFLHVIVILVCYETAVVVKAADQRPGFPWLLLRFFCEKTACHVLKLRGLILFISFGNTFC